VVILSVLQQNRRDKMEKMILKRALPVLVDTFDGAYAEAYSVSDAHAFNFFDSRGCLVPNTIETGKRMAIDGERIREILRGMVFHG